MSSFLGWCGLAGSGKIISVFEVDSLIELQGLQIDVKNSIKLSELYPIFTGEEISLPSSFSINARGVYLPSSDDTIYSVCDTVYTIKGRPFLGFTHGYYSYTNMYGNEDKATGFLSYIGGFSSEIHSLNNASAVLFNSTIYAALLSPASYYVAFIASRDRSTYGNIYFAIFDSSGIYLTSTHIAAYPEYVYLEDLIVREDKNSALNDSLSGDPYSPGGNSSGAGGGGFFGQDDRNDNVAGDIPGGSNFGYIGGSIFTHYALSGSQAKHFGEWLWTDSLGLSLWKTVMEKLFNETADALVSLMCFPFNISTLPGISLVDGNIIAGNLNTGIPTRVLSSPYVSINWGAVTLNEYWGNFLDYAPHTKLELYLPWSTGYVPLDPHQCVPGSVSVTTNIDLQKGTCTHNVFAGNTVLGVYEGQCGYEIPLLASNFSAKLAGATVAAVSTAVSAVAASGAAISSAAKTASALNTTNKEIGALAYSRGGLSNVTPEEVMAISKFNAPNLSQEAKTFAAVNRGLPAKLASASSSATAKQPVNVSRNGSFSGSSAGMSVPYPFIVISRPEQNVPVGYGHQFGYPSNIGVPSVNIPSLDSLKGYTEIGSIHLNGLKALPDEIAELDDILKGGFII